jgi:PAS domain S-box-containing protein/diguanylate cyclase (GGDEF)-like protein
MTDRIELMEAALDSYPDGIVLLGLDGEPVFWNQAAQEITGYAATELLGRLLPEELEQLLQAEGHHQEPAQRSDLKGGGRAVVELRHKHGDVLRVLTRVTVLRNGMGERIGSVVAFHPAENLNLQAEDSDSEDASASELRADMMERMLIQFDNFKTAGTPFGILRTSIDQAEALAKTHGAGAQQTMIGKLQHALAHGLRHGEEVGRWGENEFLILTHERDEEALMERAQTYVGLARTADFRWWGDRVSITVSIGAAQAVKDPSGELAESLSELLKRARQAMETSIREGGNRATAAAVIPPQAPAAEDRSCSQS